MMPTLPGLEQPVPDRDQSATQLSKQTSEKKSDWQDGHDHPAPAMVRWVAITAISTRHWLSEGLLSVATIVIPHMDFSHAA